MAVCAGSEVVGLTASGAVSYLLTRGSQDKGRFLAASPRRWSAGPNLSSVNVAAVPRDQRRIESHIRLGYVRQVGAVRPG